MHVMMSVVMVSCNDRFMNMLPKNVVIKWTYCIVIDDHKNNKIESLQQVSKAILWKPIPQLLP